MNGIGHRTLGDVVQTGAVNDTAEDPADEFKTTTIFSDETSISVCRLKNLSTKDIVNELVEPLVAIERAYDRTEDRPIILLDEMTFNAKGDPVT
jgi:hypothetical protein